MRSETRRGRRLDEFPLVMCGVDFNGDALVATGATLSAAGVPHALMRGDIGDPASMQRSLEAKLGVTRDQASPRPPLSNPSRHAHNHLPSRA